MAATTVLIESVGARVAVFHSLVKDCNYVFLTRTLNDHQVFHKESIFYVPADLKTATRWVKQISQLLIIHFNKGSLNIELFRALCHSLPHVAY
jgi:hypothetical protein